MGRELSRHTGAGEHLCQINNYNVRLPADLRARSTVGCSGCQAHSSQTLSWCVRDVLYSHSTPGRWPPEKAQRTRGWRTSVLSHPASWP
jgi:hypothetical protein